MTKHKYTVEERATCEKILTVYERWDKMTQAARDNYNKEHKTNAGLKIMLSECLKGEDSLIVQLIRAFCIQWTNDLYVVCKAVIDGELYNENN